MSETSSQVDKAQSQHPRLTDMVTPRIVSIFAISLLYSATAAMVLPFLVVYFHQTMGFSTYESGLLVAAPFFTALLFGMVGGYLSDRFGIVWSLSIAMGVSGITNGSVGLAHSFILMLILMLVSGLVLPVAISGLRALLNKTAQTDHRGTLQNYLYWVNNIGMILGLLVSSQLLHAGHSSLPLFLFGAIRLTLSFVTLIFFANISLQRLAADTGSKTSLPPMLVTLKFAFTDRALLYGAGTFLLMVLMESQWSATVPLYFDSEFSQGTALLGPVLAINTVIVVVFQPISVKVFQKRNAVPVFAIGAFCTGLGFAIGGVVGTLWSWILGTVVYSVGEVIALTKLNHFMGELPTSDNAALYFSTFHSGQNVAMLLGLSLGAAAFQAFTPTILFGSMVAVAIIAAVLFYRATSAYRHTRLVEPAIPSGAVGSLSQE